MGFGQKPDVPKVMDPQKCEATSAPTSTCAHGVQLAQSGPSRSHHCPELATVSQESCAAVPTASNDFPRSPRPQESERAGPSGWGSSVYPREASTVDCQASAPRKCLGS